MLLEFRRFFFFFFFSSRRRHTRLTCDWSSDVCSSDLIRDRGSAGGGRSRRAPRQRERARGADAPLGAGAEERRAGQGGRYGRAAWKGNKARDRKSVEEGERVGVGGRRIGETSVLRCSK